MKQERKAIMRKSSTRIGKYKFLVRLFQIYKISYLQHARIHLKLDRLAGDLIQNPLDRVRQKISR